MVRMKALSNMLTRLSIPRAAIDLDNTQLAKLAEQLVVRVHVLHPIDAEPADCAFCTILRQGAAKNQKVEENLDTRVHKLCQLGRVIDAIKLVRAEKFLGLKESKDYVDNLRGWKPVR